MLATQLIHQTICQQASSMTHKPLLSFWLQLWRRIMLLEYAWLRQKSCLHQATRSFVEWCVRKLDIFQCSISLVGDRPYRLPTVMLEPGFAHATVSKALAVLSFSSFFVSDIQSQYGLAVKDLGTPSLFRRLLTSQLLFAEGDGAFFAMFVFYVCRQIERQMGSSKFLGYCVTVSVVASLTQLQLLYLFPTTFAADSLSSGPYALAFGLMMLYWRWVPLKRRMARTTFLGIKISEKFMTYLFCLQCFVAHGLSSAIPSFTAIFPTAIYLSGVRHGDTLCTSLFMRELG